MTESQQTFACPTCESEFFKQEVARNHIKSCRNNNTEPEPPEKPDSVSRGSTEVKNLPVSRNYDWNSYIPSRESEYHETQKEKTKIMAEIQNRDTTGQKSRYLISGATGAGKTHLAESIATELDAPMFTIQGKYSMDEGDLLGSPVLVNGETIWTDGTLTKALLASQKQEVVLLVDELNRARPESKGVLFSALDDRCQVELDARGGETVQGDPDNLIVIGTMNEGSEYEVQSLDKAEKRRFGRKFEVQHLGVNNPEKEAQVLQNRSPAHSELAREMIEVVNEIRNKSKNPDSVVNSGVPTSTLIEWGQTAFAHSATDGMSNPMISSAEDTIVKPIFDDEKVRTEVVETVKDYFDGCPFDKDGYDKWSMDSEEYDERVCTGCGEVFKSERGRKQHQTLAGCGDAQ